MTRPFLVDCEWTAWTPESGCPICYKKKNYAYNNVRTRGYNSRLPIQEEDFEDINHYYPNHRGIRDYDPEKINKLCENIPEVCSKR